jgi:hypothetical protein
MRGLLLMLAFLVGGCRCVVDFPENLLADGQGRLDVLASDGTRAENGPDRSSEGRLDLSCVPSGTVCCTDADCGAATSPTCDPASHQCRRCKEHKECAAGICATDGSCPAATLISYVDAKATCIGAGTKQSPYCAIGSAVAAEPKYILVAPGKYTVPVTFDSSHEVYGAVAADTTIGLESNAPSVSIKAGASVLLSGFTILGGVSVSGEHTQATLIRNVIGPSTTSAGVAATGADKGPAKVTVRRCLIYDNPGGGIMLDANDFEIVNNIIVHNGSSTTETGGAKLKTLTTGTFVNNTVAGNHSKADNADHAGGVFCPAAFTLVNNIFWDNDEASAPGGQVGAKCVLDHADAGPGDPGGAAASTGVITDAPKFKAVPTDPTTAADHVTYYQLDPSSPCAGKGTATDAPPDDYDGKTRANPPGLGAFEVP